jgi:ABC-type multidrug transport system fused ATPase/permease subunit
MFEPKKKKEEDKPKLTKESYQRAKGIFSYMKPYRGAFALGWFFLIFSSAVGLIFPYILGQLLGAPVMNGASMSSGFIDAITFANINQIAVALFVLFGLQSFFSFFRIVLFTKVTENTLADLRYAAFDRLLHMPLAFFDRNKVGELTSRITGDINLIQDTLKTTIAEFFRQIVTIFGGIIWLFFLSWKLALIMLATVPIMSIIAVFFGRFIRGLSKDAQESTAKSNAILEESLSGINNVKSFTNEVLELSRYKIAIEEIKRMNIKSGNWRGVFVSFIFLFLFGAIVFIIWQGVTMVQSGDLSLTQFNAFLIFTVMLGASVGSLPELYASIQKAVGATERLMQLIQEDSEKELYKGEALPELKGNISFKNVYFAYPQRKDVQVLRGLNLEIAKGQTVALVGHSGVGKSTVASLLLHCYKADSGEIRFDDVLIDEISVKHLRAQIAIVPQELILFSGTIRENIEYGKPGATQEEIENAARKAFAYEFINGFPDKFETQVGDRGIQLSGGQKQRIAIARAILKNPKILILDEATSALDSESEKLVQLALEDLMKNRTSVVIAHRLSTIRKADKIVVMEKGVVIEEGTHEELLALQGAYANLMQTQSFS